MWAFDGRREIFDKMSDCKVFDWNCAAQSYDWLNLINIRSFLYGNLKPVDFIFI